MLIDKNVVEDGVAVKMCAGVGVVLRVSSFATDVDSVAALRTYVALNHSVCLCVLTT